MSRTELLSDWGESGFFLARSNSNGLSFSWRIPVCARPPPAFKTSQHLPHCGPGLLDQSCTRGHLKKKSIQNPHSQTECQLLEAMISFFLKKMPRVDRQHTASMFCIVFVMKIYLNSVISLKGNVSEVNYYSSDILLTKNQNFSAFT